MALGALLLYSLFSSLVPLLGTTFGFVLLGFAPWVINQSLRFSMRMTSYRNVRFSFQGTYWETFWYLFFLPFLSLFTLYLIFPLVLKRIDDYLVNNTRYGDKPFEAKLSALNYYFAAARTAFITLGMFVALVAIPLSIYVGGVDLEAMLENTGQNDNIASMVAVVMVYAVFLTVPKYVYRSYSRNHIYDRTRVPGVAKLRSELSTAGFMFIGMTNALAVVCTFGLAYPWTRIRVVEYLARATAIGVEPGADAVLDSLQSGPSSFADEAGELFDMDVDFG